jgi:hypothetical protein
MIFGPDADLAKHEEKGALPDMIQLQWQVSYFGDQEGFDGLKTHLGDDEVSLTVLNMLWRIATSPTFHINHSQNGLRWKTPFSRT